MKRLLWCLLLATFACPGSAVSATIHAAPNGLHLSPFDTWAKAATNIHDAVALAGALDTVLVSNGVYAVTNVVVADGIRLESVNGPAVTTLRRDAAYGEFRLLTVSNAATVAGFTLENGAGDTSIAAAQDAWALDIRGGVVSNVVVAANNYRSATPTVRVENGTLTASVISNNVRGELRLYANAVVTDTLVTGNNDHFDSVPVRLSSASALMDRCRVAGNVSGHNARYSAGVGVRLEAGTLRNTLVTANAYTDSSPGGAAHAGGVYISGGTMENCTVAGNTNHINNAYGRGVHQAGGTIRNGIIHGNDGSLTQSDYTASGGSIVYSLAPALTPGAPNYNLALDPLFADADYRLAVGSPCRDTGTNLAAVVADLEGNPRPQVGGTRGGAFHDMGAYEMDGTSGPFAIGFYGDAPRSGQAPLDVTFRPNAVGAETNVTWYGWDFDNDATYDLEGAGLPTVSNTFGPGLYSIVLRASNSLGEVAAATNLNYVSGVGTDLYVATNGAHVFPFGSWADAATNLNEAVGAAVDGSTVWISNGSFRVSGEMSLAGAIAVRGVNGPQATTAWRDAAYGAFSMFVLDHADASLSGLTLTNASTGVGVQGAATRLLDGLVSNCVLTASFSSESIAYVSGGRMTACVVSNNTHNGAAVRVDGGVFEESAIAGNFANGAPAAAGLSLYGGVARQCRILANTNSSNYGSGGVNMIGSGARFENCLVYGNAFNCGGGSGGAGGVYLQQGAMVNCTVARNAGNGGTSTRAGGVWQIGGSVTNCIVYANAGYPEPDDYKGTGSAVWRSCAPELTWGAQGNLTIDPRFADLAAHDYRLTVASPCRDSGTNLAAVAVDIDGNPRPRAGGTRWSMSHDMGAYEMDGASGPFAVGFYGDPPLKGLVSLDATFRPNAVGADTNITWYGWDFDDDGTLETNGVGLPPVSYTFGGGLHSVVLWASNGVGEVAATTNEAYVSVVLLDLYVATNGAHAFPFDTWAKAATNLGEAVVAAVDSCTVHVGPGTFLTTGELALEADIDLVGSGPMNTIVQRDAAAGAFGVLRLAHSNALAADFTVANGSGGVASGVHVAGGVASNLAVTGCGWPRAVYIENGRMTASAISNNSYGVNVAANGTLDDCAIVSNAQYASGDYVPLALTGGGALVDRCRVVGNYGAPGHGRYLYAFGVRVVDGTLRSALVAGNWIADSWSYSTDAGGVLISGGTMENCTIVANSNYVTSAYGKGVHQTGGTIRNGIVHSNGGSTVAGDYETTAGTITYSLAPELTHGDQGNITNAPQFEEIDGDLYRLAAHSPGVNAGLNLPGMETGFDLAGKPRIGEGVVDMGAYERPALVGTFILLR